MAGISTHTVLSINGDASRAGIRLFNGRYVQSLFDSDDGVWLFCDKLFTKSSSSYDKYLIDSTLSEASALHEDYYSKMMSCEVYNDQGQAITTMIAAKDIISGIDYGDSQCVLYIKKGGKIKKVTCNATIQEVAAAFAETEEAGDTLYLTDKEGEIINDKQGNPITVKTQI